MPQAQSWTQSWAGESGRFRAAISALRAGVAALCLSGAAFAAQAQSTIEVQPLEPLPAPGAPAEPAANPTSPQAPADVPSSAPNPAPNPAPSLEPSPAAPAGTMAAPDQTPAPMPDIAPGQVPDPSLFAQPGEPAPSLTPEELAALPAAMLQGLDKTTARVSSFAAPIDIPARFGTLQITARTCQKKPPTEPPESAAFLEIVDVRPDSPAVPVFSGWMFASSPAISALEHPVYDVWVVDCRAAGEAAVAGEARPAPTTGTGPTDDAPGEFPEDPEGEAVPEGEGTGTTQ
jgi:hypothetical protein